MDRHTVFTVAAVYFLRLRAYRACASRTADDPGRDIVGGHRRHRPPLQYPTPQSVDKRCRRSHGRVERLAMDGPLVSRYLTLSYKIGIAPSPPAHCRVGKL